MKAEETLINCLCGMKRKAHGTQKPRHINRIIEFSSTCLLRQAEQRGDSPTQVINHSFPKFRRLPLLIFVLALSLLCACVVENPETALDSDSTSTSSVVSDQPPSNMVLVEGGVFQMGSASGGEYD